MSVILGGGRLLFEEVRANLLRFFGCCESVMIVDFTEEDDCGVDFIS